MPRRTDFLSSSVGTKIAIALTGLSLVGFLIMHLAGNLLVLVGPGPFNDYSHALISNPLLIPAELGLLAIFLIHVYKTATMWLANQRARPTKYAVKERAHHTSRKSIASSTMIVSGVVVAIFLGLHLKTFKYGAHYQVTGTGIRDLYRLVIEVFSHPGYVAFYAVAMIIVGLHLRHGISSAFQSLGIDHPRYTPKLLAGGTLLAILIGGGFAMIPVLVFFMRGRS
jgi:succinate dehydrogenase / fumarate reductase cytochrome b subunit